MKRATLKQADKKLKLLTIKISEEELILIKAKAKWFAAGNVSLWLRYCGVNHVPKKEDL